MMRKIYSLSYSCAEKPAIKLPLKLYFGIALLLCCVFFILYQYGFSSYLPQTTALQYKNCAPSYDHVFGTDELGRDLFARVCQGMSISFFIGIVAFVINITIGVLWGAIMAISYPHPIYEVMNRIAQILYSLPYLLVVILISMFTGTGLIPLIITMSIMGWIQTARVVEQLIKEALQSEYVLSAQVIGVSLPKIIYKHILPNILGPLIATALTSIPHAIFSEAFLSFLGVGVQPPVASLGSLVSDALPALRFYPWRIIFPSIAITFLILSISLISDGIFQISDPKLNRQLS